VQRRRDNAPKAWSEWVTEGKALIGAGNYAAAAQAFRRASVLAEAANAGKQKLVEIYDALASAYAEAGQYAESEHEYRRALALAKKDLAVNRFSMPCWSQVWPCCRRKSETATLWSTCCAKPSPSTAEPAPPESWLSYALAWLSS
jgi:tetratricopeptide (TPR) repeat protein